MNLNKNLYCICGTVYEVTEYEDHYVLTCPFCGKSDKINREHKFLTLTISKDNAREIKMKETEHKKVYKIISDTNGMLHEGKFEEIDEIIGSLDIASCSTSELVAWATATYWPNTTDNKPNDRLKNRKEMFDKIEKELRSRTDWDPMHLYGLEGD